MASYHDPNWVPPPLPPIPNEPARDLSNFEVHVWDLTPPADPPNFPDAPLASGILGLCPIESARVEARGCKAPITAYACSQDEITLMVSDEKDEAFWLNITFTRAHLAEMLAALIEVRKEEFLTDVVYEVLKGLGQP